MACCSGQKEPEDDVAGEEADEGPGGKGTRGGGYDESDRIPKEGLIETYTSGSVDSQPAADATASTSYVTDSKRGRYAEEQEQEQDEHCFSSGSGATEALSETVIPVGQSSTKHNSRHHRHRFAAPEPFQSYRAGKCGDAGQCDIAGHEHNQCCACHKSAAHAFHQQGDSCESNRLLVVKTSAERHRWITRQNRNPKWLTGMPAIPHHKQSPPEDFF
ncbi:hypothetical protein R1sor_002202 [Riccia sorocarpa]|uniref:Uncharacterized protein n=1 Tax=Riccia sorocarpa TaxID=122646 RepID=A0ABD3GY56_9MARC